MRFISLKEPSDHQFGCNVHTVCLRSSVLHREKSDFDVMIVLGVSSKRDERLVLVVKLNLDN
jgi:hypothetical protein